MNGNKREIKFRAWEKGTQDMVYWKRLVMKPDVLIDIFDGDKQFELMQYTGLKDKNGKEMYEGDIVRFYFEATSFDGGEYDTDYATEMIDDVYFEDGCFWVRLLNEPQHGSAYLYRHNKHCEVIGNIYENANLMEEVSNDS